jgi:uncharacterized protein
MRKALGITAIVLVALLVIGLGAGGWYYTDQLLPAPVPGEPDYDAEVVASDEAAGTITIGVGEGDLVDLERLGFWTATGTLDLGEVTDTGPDSVTRTATLLDGDWPGPGERGTASVTTFRGDPEVALGLAFSEVEVDGPDGVLPAWLVPGAEASDDEAGDAEASGETDGDGSEATGSDHTYAVMVHGRGATREELHRSLRTVNAVGLDALVITVRNDPEAPADPDGWGRFGDVEWEDLQAAVDHLVDERGADRLVLVGSSQGGSIVLSYLRRGTHTDLVDGVVLTSPIVSMHDTLVLQAQGRGVPDVAIPPLLWSTKLLATLRSGLRFDRLEHAAEDRVDAYHAPMLVIHGTADSTVPSEGSEQLADARPDLVQLERYDGVEHVREWNADPDRFEADLDAFLRSVTD